MTDLLASAGSVQRLAQEPDSLRGPAHTAVHRQVCQPVRMTVLLPQNMLNLEVFELGDAAFRLLVEGPKFRAIHPILPLHLFDHEFRVGDDPQAPVPVGDGKFQGGEKRGVLGKVIGTGAQVFAQFGENLSG